MKYRLWILGLSLCLWTLAGVNWDSASAQDILRGHLELQRQIYTGQVRDAQTGQPIEGANVYIPDKGYTTKTGKDGQFQVPGYMADKPVILSVEKEGYAPFALSISQSSSPNLNVTLRKQLQMLVLDKQLRHLGDNSFSVVSSNAMQFRKNADGPAIRIPFVLSGYTISSNPTLEIGSIIGLDTAMMHLLNGSNLSAKATPLTVKLNGKVIAQIQVNGDQQKIQIPKNLLKGNGENVLELETGYQITKAQRLDYDDIELMHLVLNP